MFETIKTVAEAIVAVMFALAMLCAVLANVLPEGRLKTAFSYAGLRLVKAVKVYRSLSGDGGDGGSPRGEDGDRHATPPPPPPPSSAYRLALPTSAPARREKRRRGRLPFSLMKLGVAAIGVALLASCSWLRPARHGEPPPAQAVVLYTAKAVDAANRQCVAAAARMLERSRTEEQAIALETLTRAKALNEECRKLTVTARAALEGAEHLIELGQAIDEKKVGCAIKRGLDAAQDICTAMRSAHVGTCPNIVDSAITFGSPLIAAVGACPLKEGP